MKTIISAIIVAGALSQMANAMGPMGDTTHRHFYKDQEWIWQKEDSRSNNQSSTGAKESFTGAHVWNLPIAFGLPNHPPYVAFGLPNHPPYVAFGLPNHPPYVAFGLPNHPPYVAFGLPNHPPYVAFGLPNHPPYVAFGLPNHPPYVTFDLATTPTLALGLSSRTPSAF
jgi:hypothetical protein